MRLFLHRGLCLSVLWGWVFVTGAGWWAVGGGSVFPVFVVQLLLFVFRQNLCLARGVCRGEGISRRFAGAYVFVCVYVRTAFSVCAIRHLGTTVRVVSTQQNKRGIHSSNETGLSTGLCQRNNGDTQQCMLRQVHRCVAKGRPRGGRCFNQWRLEKKEKKIGEKGRADGGNSTT